MRRKQQTLAASGFERYRKRNWREAFLAEVADVVPWRSVVELIDPVYRKGEGADRPPVGLERMLRILCLQHWFNLSDPAVEEALCDWRVMREFVGIDVGR
jgi:IS5 family transposase